MQNLHQFDVVLAIVIVTWQNCKILIIAILWVLGSSIMIIRRAASRRGNLAMLRTSIVARRGVQTARLPRITCVVRLAFAARPPARFAIIMAIAAPDYTATPGGAARNVRRIF